MTQRRMYALLTCVVACVLLGGIACAAEWDLVADFSSTANPNGTWEYGFLKSGEFTVYTVQESPEGSGPPGTGNSVFAGWHGSSDWDLEGSIGKNIGSNPISGFLFYTDPGEMRIQGSNDGLSKPGARWTCPEAGRYYVTAGFRGAWLPDGGHALTAQVLRGIGLTGSKVIDGFYEAPPHYEGMFGESREYQYANAFDLQVGDTILFVGGGVGAYGHAARITAHIAPYSGQLCVVSGYVKDRDTQTGIPGALVTNPDGSLCAITGEDGYYMMGLPTGTVTLNASAATYTSGEPQTFPTTAGTSIAKDFELIANGYLEGFVNSAVTGYQIEGATVTVGSVSVTTNSSGFYSIELPPGIYTATANAGGYKSQTAENLEIVASAALDQSFSLEPVTVANLAADWPVPSRNPNGVWVYGYVDSMGAFMTYTIPETATPAVGAGLFSGWHAVPDWDVFGHIAKNVGTDPIDQWGWYAEAGQVIIGTAPGNLMTAVRWWCPAAGQYKVCAGWTAQSVQHSEDVGSVAIVRNLNTFEPLGTGTLNGFSGRKAKDFADWMQDDAGTPTEAVVTATVDLLADETLEFVSSALNGPTGHVWGLSVVIMPAASTGTISGTVTAAGSGAPIAGAKITTMDGTLTVLTDSTGHYSLDTMAGDCQVTASHWFCTSQTETVPLAAGGTATQDFVLTVQQGKISGNVTMERDSVISPAVNAKIACTIGGVEYTAYTDADGDYNIVLPAGEAVTLTATHPAATAPATAGVTVPDNLVTLTQDFAFTHRAACTFYVKPGGNDSADGLSPAAAWATIDNGDVLGLTEPGDTVKVMAGTYTATHPFSQRTDGIPGFACLTRSGTADAPITYEAEPGVVLDGQGSGAYGIILCNGCSYATAKGFDIKNLNGGIALDAGAAPSDGVVVDGCVVHHTSGVAIQACNGTSTGWTWKNCVIYDGYREQATSAPAYYNGFWLDTDAHGTIVNCVIDGTNEGQLQGLRLDGTSSVVVRNTVFMRCGWCAVRNRTGDVAKIDVDYCTFFENGLVGDGSGPDYNGPVTPGANDLTGTNPLFVNNLAGNFRLKFGSPCIDTGLDVGIPFLGNGPDRGAYETPRQVASLRDARDLDAGEVIDLTAAQVATVATGTFTDGRYYIENADRTVGMMVIPAAGLPTVTAGARVTLKGSIAVDSNGEKHIAATAQTPVAGAALSAVGIGGKAVAGCPGLFARVWGKVTEKTADYATINDGSGVLVRVILTATTSPITKSIVENNTISVSGPVGLAEGGVLAVRPRSNDDIRVY